MKKWIALISLAVIFGTTASGTTVRRMQLRDLVREADLIVLGKVIGVDSEWRGRSLVTRVKVDVQDSIKGRRARSVTITVPGGVGATRGFDKNRNPRRVPIAMIYPGAPSFFPEEYVVVFLDRASTGAYSVTGFSQGLYKFSEEEGRRYVTQDPSAAKLRDPSGNQLGDSNRIPLDEFIQAIKKHLK